MQLRQVTSDCKVPPKIDVTRECEALDVPLNRLYFFLLGEKKFYSVDIFFFVYFVSLAESQLQVLYESLEIESVFHI